MTSPKSFWTTYARILATPISPRSPVLGGFIAASGTLTGYLFVSGQFKAIAVAALTGGIVGIYRLTVNQITQAWRESRNE